MILLRHNRVDLALHQLRDGDGLPLLLLHGLGEATPADAPGWTSAWPGPVHGLDFTGHGASTIPRGGGYTSEMLMADADIALAHLGSCAVLGRGLGGYVALLLAGARATSVQGTIVADGPGLAGGGPVPITQDLTVPAAVLTGDGPPDPFALMELARDVRPADYSSSFVRLAIEGSSLDDPIAVTARVHPPWLAAIVDQPGVVQCTLDEALTLYAG